jgi:chromosome segregation ATPase
MDSIDQFVQTRARIDEWAREGEQLLGQVIPSFIEDWASQHRHVERLRQESEDQAAEIAALRGEIEQLKRERADMEEATAAYLSEINRITVEIGRRLKAGDDRVRGRVGLRAV